MSTTYFEYPYVYINMQRLAVGWWDDIFIIAGFDLEAESPFPKPDAEILERKPDRVPYKSNEIK